MNTTQLECFLAVANSLNFSRAAEQLRLTQPAVSHQISSLEDELGVRLFSRTSRSVRLTQEGYLFTQYAGEILRLFNVSRGRVRAVGEDTARTLGIGCRNTLELRLLTRALGRLRGESEGFIPLLRVVPHDSLEMLLLDGEIAMMPTFRESCPKGAVYRELCSVGVACAVSHESPAAGRESLSVQEICALGRVALSRPNASPREIVAVQNQLIAGHSPGDIIFCESIETQLATIAAGFAVAVFAKTPGLELAGVEFIPVEDTTRLSYGVAYMADELTPLLRRLMGMLAAESAKYEPN